MSGLTIAILGFALVIGIVWAFAYYDGLEARSIAAGMTCDELYKIDIGWSRYAGDAQSYMLNTKCIAPIFPNGVPDELELRQYFLDLECSELGIHVLKEHFEHDVAKEIYEIRCITPLDAIDINVTLDRSEVKYKETENLLTEPSYGKQYERWD